jgi:hypothetical protein
MSKQGLSRGLDADAAGGLALLTKLPSSQRNLITEGQPVILEIVVTEDTHPQ